MDDTAVAEAIRLCGRAQVQAQLQDVRKQVESTEFKNRAITNQIEKRTKAQAEIYAYLHSRLEDNYTQIAKLEAQIMEARVLFEAKRREMVSATEKLRAENEAELQSFQQAAQRLAVNVEDLQSFEQNRESLTMKAMSLKERLDHDHQANRQLIEELKVKHEHERDKLRRDMMFKIHETKVNIVARTEDLLDDDVKRMVLDNEKVSGELEYQNREASRMLERRDDVLRNNAELKRRIAEAKAEEVRRARVHHQARQELGATLRSIRAPVEPSVHSERSLSGSAASPETSLSMPPHLLYRTAVESRHVLKRLRSKLQRVTADLDQAKTALDHAETGSGLV